MHCPVRNALDMVRCRVAGWQEGAAKQCASGVDRARPAPLVPTHGRQPGSRAGRRGGVGGALWRLHYASHVHELHPARWVVVVLLGFNTVASQLCYTPGLPITSTCTPHPALVKSQCC